VRKTIDTGVFIPVGNNGWITSVNAPPAETGTFERVRKVVQGAEALGFDFVLSPAIWRGRKGPSRHWTNALESLTTSAALLEATSRIAVFSTVHMTVFPPAVIAKMVATLDQIGPGRVGLNLVTGSSFLDLAHIGLWNDELDHDQRYDMADEWIELVKKLWTDEVIDHQGKFFQTMEGQMGPKPSVLPRLVNAGASPRGFRFAAENCNIAFFPTGDDQKNIETARRGKEIAREAGSPHLRSYGVVNIIPGDTDDEAQERMEFFDAGVDREALADVAAGYQLNRSAKDLSAASQPFRGGEKLSSVPGPMVGSYETLARRLATTVIECDLDGLMITVPDYVVDLEAVAKKTMPLMAEYGVTCRVGAPSSS
jgi:pyrimidine oxygenase